MWNFLSIKFHKDQQTEKTLCWHCKVKIMFFIISILTSTVPTGTLLSHWMLPLYRACSLASWLSERFSRKRKQWFSRPRLRLPNVAAYNDAKRRIKTAHRSHRTEADRETERTETRWTDASGLLPQQQSQKRTTSLQTSDVIRQESLTQLSVPGTSDVLFISDTDWWKVTPIWVVLLVSPFFCFNPFCGE